MDLMFNVDLYLHNVGGAGLGHSEVMENCLYCYLSIKLCTLSGGGEGRSGGGGGTAAG